MPVKSYNRNKLLRSVKDAYFTDTPVYDQQQTGIDLTNLNKDIYLPNLPQPPNQIMQDSAPSTYEKIMGSISPGVNQFIQGDLERGEPNVDIAGPVFQGIRAIPQTKEVLDKIIEAKPQSVIDAGIEWLKQAYPNYTKISEMKKVPAAFLDIFGTQRGYYDDVANTANIRDVGGLPIKEIIDTGAHEVAHGYQTQIQKRLKEMKISDVKPDPNTAYDFLKDPEVHGLDKLPWNTPGEYVTAGIPREWLHKIPLSYQDKYKAAQFKLYQDQKVEQQARKAGETAAKKFHKFLNILSPDDKPFDMQQPLTRENFQGIVQDLLFNQYKEGIESLKRPGLTPEYVENIASSYRNNLKHALDSASAYLVKGHPDANREWFNQYYAENYPKQVEIGDILPAHLMASERDLLKERGYTSVKGRYMDKHDLRKTFEEILGLKK